MLRTGFGAVGVGRTTAGSPPRRVDRKPSAEVFWEFASAGTIRFWVAWKV